MSWKKVRLGDISNSIQTGPFGSQLHKSDYSVEGIPVVMPKDIVDGKLSDESIARVNESHVNRLKRHKIEVGDILYSRRGDVGRCALATKNEEGWLCGTGCLRVTINTDIANPKFIFYQLQKKEIIGWVEKHAVGATMLNLNTSILSDVPIELPNINEQNIVMYYSLYRFRLEWEFFNIKMLRVLWNYHGDMKSDEEAVIQKIKNTNIGHRFEKKMYTKLMEYIDASPNGNLFNTVCKDGILDAFYIWTIKSSVTNSDEVMYCIYQDDYDMASQIAIINEVSKHDELLECQTIAEWLQYMKYKTFAGQTSFPEKLEISLRCLLLTGMHVLVVIAFMREKSYLRADIFGIYILIKINELSHKVQNQDDIKGIVRNAFIARNMNVDEYIDMIERECSICRSEINYVQKEKMKEYLLKTF